MPDKGCQKKMGSMAKGDMMMAAADMQKMKADIKPEKKMNGKM